MGFAGKEMQRQACLREMGIVSYYPRKALPGTRALRTYDKPEMTEPIQASASVAPASQSGSNAEPAQRLLQELNQESWQKSPVSHAEDTAQVKPQAIAAVIDVPRFSFAYCAVAARLAVICATPDQHQGRLQAPARGLLMAILKAMGVAVAEHSLRFVPFKWPMHDGLGMASDMRHARDVLQGFLNREIREQGIGNVLVFSEQWPDYLFPENFSAADDRALIIHPEFPFSVLVTRGLHAMLADETLKRPVWSQLQQIKGRLNTE